MAVSLRRMMMRLMGFGVVVVLVLAVSSSSTTNESDEPSANAAKANSWIIRGPTRPIRPGFGLPPGGMLLMTMDPNATMPDAMTNEAQEAVSQPPATEVSVTSEEPAVETQAPEVDDSEPEVTTASSSAETEQPASEEPLVNDVADSSSSSPEEELVTSEPEEVPATEVAPVDEGTESAQSDAEAENIQPEAEVPQSGPSHEELITTEQPEIPQQSDEALTTEGPEEPVVAALAQEVAGVTTLVPEELPSNEAAQQETHDEASHGSDDTEELSVDVVTATESAEAVTESDIVEVDIGNGVVADTTLVQIDLPSNDGEGSGSGVFDPEAGSGQEIHLSADEGSGSGQQVALELFDEAAELGSGQEGSGDVVQDLPVVDVATQDAPVEEVHTQDASSEEEVSAESALVQDSSAEDTHPFEAGASAGVAEDLDAEVAGEPAVDGEPQQSADLVVQEPSADFTTSQPEQDQPEEDSVTDSTPSEASPESISESLIADTTEADPQTTPSDEEEAEFARRRRDVQNAEESEVSPKEATSDNQIESDPADDESRRYHRRPYPIRPGLRRPFYPQRNGPVYNEYGVLSRTAEYCYTMWCKFKTSLRRLF